MSNNYPYGSRYVVKQFVTHANQYEAIPEGAFDTEEAAVAAMNDLVASCGFSDLVVFDYATGETIAETDC